MRLDALELVRYGHFDNRTIEFRKSGKSKNATDLQVIYGPNEAGKSTIREAISDLLFKVPARSKMNFAAQGVLKIGAKAVIAETSVEAYRLKKNNDDLVDANDNPLRDNPFALVTDGFDRASFEQTFSVNREQLEAGGDMILKGEGDLGQLLFAGTTGLQGLPEKLSDLDEQAAAIWSRKSSASARVLVDEIKAIDQKIRDLQTTQSTYDGKRREVDRLNDEFETSKNELSQTEAEIHGVAGKLDALKPYRDRLRILEALDELGDGETATEDDLERLNRLTNKLAALDGRSNSVKEKKEELVLRHNEIPGADRIVEFQEAIVEFGKDATHIRAYRNDRPNRETEVTDAMDTIDRVLRELDVETTGDDADFSLPSNVRRTLSTLLNQQTELRTSEAAATHEVESATKKLNDAVRALEGLGNISDPSVLRAVLKASQERDFDAEQRDIFRLIAGQRQEIALALDSIGLSPEWDELLVNLDLPDIETVERLDEHLKKANEAVVAQEAALGHRNETVAAAEDHLKALGDVADWSDEALNSARTSRDEVVADLRGELSVEQTENLRLRLVTSIASTDQIFEERILSADRVSEVNALVRTRDRERVAGARVSSNRDTARETLRNVEDEIASLVPEEVSVSGVTGLRLLIQAHANVRAAFTKIRTCNDELEKVIADELKQVETLRQTLSGVGCTVSSDTDLKVVQNLAEEYVVDLETRARDRTSAESKKSESERDLKLRTEELDSVTSALTVWEREFSSVISQTGIPAETEPAQVSDILTRLPELTEARAKLETAQHRLDRMDEDTEAVTRKFEAFLEASRLEVPDELGGADFLMLIDHLNSRLADARSRNQVDEDLVQEIEGLDSEIVELGQRIIENRSEVADLVEKFGVSEFSELQALIRDAVKRQALRNSLGEFNQSIVEALGVTTIDEALEILDELDEDELRSKHNALGSDRVKLQSERDESGQAYAVANAEFLTMTGSDEIARLNQERETIKADLLDQVQDYMRIRTGEKILNWALTRYRQANKAPMLEAAGNFFSRMTANRYLELITQPGDKGDVLVAREESGPLKTVDALSEGTRHQLFLALRMAGYLELARGRQAPPLILDDILSSSDDVRTGAVFEALATLAKEVQVIVLTHHAHVLEIASKVVKGQCSMIRLDEAV
jgi:uncharacterized protein YhaN